MNQPILSTSSLSVGYNGKAVIEKVELEAEPGRIITLIGPNGAGKSTILKTLIRQLKPVSGTVTLNGKDMQGLADREIARSMSAVLTHRPHPEMMNCEDVIASGRYPYTGRLGILTKEDRQIVAEAMELVQVKQLAERDFNRISDGQRQRVMLARAICQEPKVLVLDEPTSFLDIKHKLDFLFLLKELVRQRQLAVILSLHELDLAQRFSDTVVCVRNGVIDRYGPPEDIFQGNYIEDLYQVEHGSYNALFGSVETEAIRGSAKVFVVSGGGSGIPIFRKLQRLSVPFATGVLSESDTDYPIAYQLASKTVSVPAFEIVTERAAAQALDEAKACNYVVCSISSFGAANRNNELIVDYAEKSNKLIHIEEIDRVAEKEQ